MPVTARLSKLFLDRFGEEVVDELVDWMNQVDATLRADQREYNELMYARFEAKLEQRLAELRADLSALDAKFERRLGEQMRWIFGLWVTLLVPLLGLWFRR